MFSNLILLNSILIYKIMITDYTLLTLIPVISKWVIFRELVFRIELLKRIINLLSQMNFK